MPQLTGVKTVSDSVIEYEGARYEKTEGEAQEGDIVRKDVGYSFMPAGTYYLADEDGYITDNDGDIHNCSEWEDTLFRYVIARPAAISTADTLAAKRAELERLQAEIAELSAKLAEEQRPTVGDYARLVGASYNEDIRGGAIVTVLETDESHIPFGVKSLIGGVTDWCAKAERITPAEARAALIAQIDAMFSGEEAPVTSD